MNESAVKEGPSEIPNWRYDRAIKHMILLRTMEEITNTEVKRLISQLKSPDPENWVVAEEAIKNNLEF